MKKSFTMIELIFVIVILGILAAVAIPKLMSTRDDATTASLTTQIKSATQEMIGYYTAQGGEINFSKIKENKGSQIVLNELISRNWVKIEDDNTSYFFSNRDNNTTCITYKTDGKQIEVDTNDSDNDTLCTDIKKIIKDRNYSILNSAVEF
jgi:prepilin-type N-terminal cleavage/methylation domain-containing protein